ncbi:hypothetical protein PtA15_8A598 [Puccinia triticina]|uniref:Autophagy-related protein 13 n=1 Tax=Puccinia triticina TaxID=208348 RepID=A0ABY7CUM9_9BASI|nr:uncharacterized protein PtA15_8A598 [Puccinia triticina]WAQ87692.1 hypothetical protein PtA15_8A598 [Puccinia triticina]
METRRQTTEDRPMGKQAARLHTEQQTLTTTPLQFNLELPEPDYFRDELRTWKTSPQNTAILVFETILDTSALPPTAALTLAHQPIPNQQQQHILLERWQIALAGNPQTALEPPTVYRHAIIHFRALFAYLHTMPAAALAHALRKPSDHRLLTIGLRISTADPAAPPSHNTAFHDLPPAARTTRHFPPIRTPRGPIHTTVTFRNHTHFAIADKESLLSSRFRLEDLRGLPPPPADSPIAAFPPVGLSVPTTNKAHPPNYCSPPTSYASLSSRHHPHPKPLPSPDQLFTPVEPSKPHPADPLTAEILAATQSSPFAPPPRSSPTPANLAAHRQSLPPVLSNALPSSPLNRSHSSAGAGPGRMAGSHAGASPRQLSVLSSSPLSGPSSSIRISAGRPHASPGVGGGLHPTASPTTTAYPPAGPTSPGPGQPMVRRYSSSRHSRSLGQASSSPAASLQTADSAGSLARRTALGAADEPFAPVPAPPRPPAPDQRASNDIAQFLQLIASSSFQPPPLASGPATGPPRRLSRPKDAPRTDDSIDPAPTIAEEEEEDADGLSLLMKEKLDLALKKLAGSVRQAPLPPLTLPPPSSSSSAGPPAHPASAGAFAAEARRAGLAGPELLPLSYHPRLPGPGLSLARRPLHLFSP